MSVSLILVDRVQAGHVAVVELLIARGANVNVANAEAVTPLYVAAGVRLFTLWMRIANPTIASARLDCSLATKI